MTTTVGAPLLEGPVAPAPREVVVSEADRAHWEQVRRWRARTLPESASPTWLGRVRRVDDVLAARPPLAPPYVLVAAAASGAVALLPGLASLVGRPGAAVAGFTGALGLAAGTSAETVLAAATCTRAVTVTGAYYGYDAVGPDGRERAIALAVLAVSLGEGADKHGADRRLRALQAGDTAPPPAVLTREVAAGLGAHLRLRGVAAVVHATPVLGVRIAALLAARLLVRVLDDADHLYRERFLREKYGLRRSVSP